MHNVFYYKFSRIESKNLIRSKNKFVISQDLNVTLLDYQNNYVGYNYVGSNQLCIKIIM